MSGSDAASALAALVRDERRQVLAVLVRTTGSLAVAEDALQDAALRAIEEWTRDGVPPNPGAWLTVAARRRAVDLLRREAARTGKEADAVRLADLLRPDPHRPEPIEDDQLRLLFTCCHPALARETRLALALRHLCGLEVAEVARALLVSETTMAKRLVRARRKIADAGIPYRVPAPEQLPGRVEDVLGVVYLLFNEGYSASAGSDHIRADLCAEAIRLARLVVRLLPASHAALALLALVLLQHARRDARLDAAGRIVLLADQDRTRWDRADIAEGVAITAALLRVADDPPHAYFVQAAIAACHDTADSAADTDRSAILAWYDVLVRVDPSPAARLARAVALAETGEVEPALAETVALQGLAGYAPWHAVQGELLDRLGRPAEARAARARALALPTTDATARHLVGLGAG